MKTINPVSKSKPETRTKTQHPEAQQAPARTGVLGTILTEVQFGEDERDALADCSEWLAAELDEIVQVAATRAREVACANEEPVYPGPFGNPPAVRPSIRNLRRHAARQWFTATLEGNYDSAFSRQIRHTWMPILLAEQYQSRAATAYVAAYLDYMEAFVASRLVATVADNIVPYWRMLHALRTAFAVQRRIFGIDAGQNP